MATNPYFRDNYSGEQNVTESIVIETIRMMGKNCFYIPREYNNISVLYGEDPLSTFTNKIEIEMYPATVNGFGGAGDLASRFGIEVKDDVTLVVSKKRFTKEVTEKFNTITRPREGDLIYFPLSKTFFEINFVEHETPFYQLGKLYTFTLFCETFVFSHEEFNTDSPLDTIMDRSKETYSLFINEAGGTFMNEFTIGDKLYQNGFTLGSSPKTAAIVNYNTRVKQLTLSPIKGTFVSGDIVVSNEFGITASMTGATSSNVVTYFNTETDNISDIDNPFDMLVQDYYAGVTPSLIDYSEDNPFSEGI